MWHSFGYMENPQGLDRQAWAYRVLLAAAGVAGVALVLATTASYGPWVSWDSVVYSDVARHIARGEGVRGSNISGQVEFVFTWPPLFPLLMSPLVALGMEPGEAGRWLNAFAHGGLAVLAGLCALRLTGRRAAGVAAAWLVALSTVFLLNATTLWSEPLFFTIVAGGLLCLLEWRARESRRWLIAGGALIGLACLQRYAGYAFIAAGVVWLLQLRGPWRERFKHAGLFLLGALPLPLLWRLCVLLFAGRVDARTEVEFVWPSADHYHVIGVALSNWMFPAALPKLVRAILAGLTGAGAVAGLVWAVRLRLRAEPGSRESSATLLAVFAACYAGIVAVTILFLDSYLHADDRLLSPLLLFVLLALVWLVFSQPGRRLVIGCSLLVLLGIGYAARDIGVVTRETPQREEFIDYRTGGSPLIAAVDALPQGVPVATNARLPLVYFTGRPVAEVPLFNRPGHLAPYHEDLSRARAEQVERLAEEGGYIAWFGHDDLPPELAGLRVMSKYEDGLLLAAR